MRPDIPLVLGAVGVWLAIFLIVPKRWPSELRRRLRETAGGGRNHAFGPPKPLISSTSDQAPSLLVQVKADWLRVVELGVPLYALAVVAENLGVQARRLAEERWVHSPSGLLLRHLRGEIDADGLTQTLIAWGYPVPPPKLAVEKPRRYRMPPLEWRLEWEASHHGDGTGAQAPHSGRAVGATEVASSADAGAPPPTLEIQTIAGLRLLCQDRDLSPELLEHPVLSFVWLYLLMRAVVAPGKPTMRAVIADELFPGLDPQVQRERFRHRLFDLHNLLPAPLAETVIATGETIWLHLEGRSLDVQRLLELAHECRTMDGYLAPDALDQARNELAASAGEFLPEFEEIERRATGGRGVAADLVREVRRLVESARVDVLMGLAQHDLVRQRPERALAYLEEARRRDPSREAVVKQLAATYEETGRARLDIDLGSSADVALDEA